MTSIYAPTSCATNFLEFTDLANIAVKIVYLDSKDSISQTPWYFHNLDSQLTDMEYIIQKLLENVIKRSLFPRSNINVYVQVLCDDGSISFFMI